MPIIRSMECLHGATPLYFPKSRPQQPLCGRFLTSQHGVGLRAA